MRKARSLLLGVYDIPLAPRGNVKSAREIAFGRRKRDMHLKFLLIGLLVTAISALGAGCGRDTASAPREIDTVHVLTTVYALADLVRQVGGDQVDVEWYVESGQSLDELSETPERRNQFRSADLVVTRGVVDKWTLEGIGNAFQDRKILRIDALPSTREMDPTHYTWLDPRTAIEIANEVAIRLANLKPKKETMFKANAAKFNRTIAEMMEQTSAAINRSGGGPFLTLDRGFTPLGRRFGMSDVNVPSETTASQASEYAARQLRKLADQVGAGAVFMNAEMPSPLLRDWQSRLQMPVLPLDALGTSAPTGRCTYVAVLRYNLEQLSTASARSKPPATTQPDGGRDDRPILPRPAESRDSGGGPRKTTASPNPFGPH
jgi:zinc transport system substrate-binding protein